jgi:hypothetical protein
MVEIDGRGTRERDDDTSTDGRETHG